MIVQRLSSHFVLRWQERMGSVPTLEEINAVLEGAQKIRGQRRVFRECRGEYEPWELLADYLNWDLGVLIRVDEHRQKAVTLIVRGVGCLKGKGGRLEARGERLEEGLRRQDLTGGNGWNGTPSRVLWGA